MSLKLRTRHGCVEVKILGVDGHEPHTGGGDNAVEEEFGGKHVCCGCATVTREVNSIASDRDANAIRVILLGAKICHNASVHYVLPLVWWEVCFMDECNVVGAIDNAG